MGLYINHESFASLICDRFLDCYINATCLLEPCFRVFAYTYTLTPIVCPDFVKTVLKMFVTVYLSLL